MQEKQILLLMLGRGLTLGSSPLDRYTESESTAYSNTGVGFVWLVWGFFPQTAVMFAETVPLDIKYLKTW